jgi:hypothetical protein
MDHEGQLPEDLDTQFGEKVEDEDVSDDELQLMIANVAPAAPAEPEYRTEAFWASAERLGGGNIKVKTETKSHWDLK